jgi:hypothetical protein
MSNELSPYGGGRPPVLPPVRATTPWTAQGRAMARSDKTTELQARQDLNDSRLAVHRAHLEAIVEKARAHARAELTQDAMLHARMIDDLVTALSAGKPALELTLRELQAAHITGETQRIMRRGMGI